MNNNACAEECKGAFGGRSGPMLDADITKYLDSIWGWLDSDLRLKNILNKKEYVNHDEPDINDFNCLELMDLTPEEEIFYNFIEEGDDPEMLWPFDFGLYKTFSGLFEGEEAVSLTRARSVSASSARGKVKMVSRYMGELMCMDICHDGRYVADKSYIAYLGGRWVDVTSGKRRTDSSMESGHTPLIFVGHRIFGLWKRYKWGVSIKRPGFPSVRFTTDATGIKSIFKLRDIPEGKRRRDSLKNWVSAHWRMSRSNKDDEIYIRKHLRGHEKFTWFGYECTVLPSDYDVEKNLIR